MGKQRLDTLLAERGLFPSRTQAAASVMAGEVRVGPGRRRAAKPGELVDVEERVTVDERPAFVSRGGVKLANALAGCGLDVAGRRALDVGASTGGFTDCLLQHEAREVIAVDVGYGMLDYRLRMDPRVRVMERTNARSLTPEKLVDPTPPGFVPTPQRPVPTPQGPATPTPQGPATPTPQGPATPTPQGPAKGPLAAHELPSVATVDVSFISLAKVLGAVLGCLSPGYDVLALVKPQFEVGRGRVGKGGVVRLAEDRRAALIGAGEAALALGAAVLAYHSSGLPGPKGNLETFIWLADPAGMEDRVGAARGKAASRSAIRGGRVSDELERMAREVEP